MCSDKNLTEKAYSSIREKIVTGLFKEGDAVSVSALADDLGISRTPVANACQQLERERFLTVVPKQGVFIKTISIDEAREIYELRTAIETYSARKAFFSLGESDLDFLIKSNEQQKKALHIKDVNAFMREDTKFHQYILFKYPNSQISAIAEALYARAFMVGVRCCSNIARLQSSIVEHEAIIAALQNNDKEAFVLAVEANIVNGYTSLTDIYA